MKYKQENKETTLDQGFYEWLSQFLMEVDHINKQAAEIDAILLKV